MFRGRRCVAVVTGAEVEDDEGFEPLSSQQSAMLFRGLLDSRQEHTIEYVLDAFGISDPATLIDDFRHGMSRVEVFAQPRDFGVFQPRAQQPEEPVDLSELAEEPEREEDHWIEVELQDPAGEPVPGFDLEIELTNGALRPCRTNLFGFTRVDGMFNPGVCKVFLPTLDPDDVPEPPPPQLQDLDFELVDENGPCANVEVEIEFADGSTQSATTDAQGMVFLSNVAAGLTTITPKSPA